MRAFGTWTKWRLIHHETNDNEEDFKLQSLRRDCSSSLVLRLLFCVPSSSAEYRVPPKHGSRGQQQLTPARSPRPVRSTRCCSGLSRHGMGRVCNDFQGLKYGSEETHFNDRKDLVKKTAAVNVELRGMSLREIHSRTALLLGHVTATV